MYHIHVQNLNRVFHQFTGIFSSIAYFTHIHFPTDINMLECRHYMNVIVETRMDHTVRRTSLTPSCEFL